MEPANLTHPMEQIYHSFGPDMPDSLSLTGLTHHRPPQPHEKS
jgi:hypothetical protein